MIIEETIEVEEKDQGFTLVELLIVIVILGILATIVVFAVRGITDQGQQSSCKATGKTYEVAIEAYYAQYGTAGGNPSGAAGRSEASPQLRAPSRGDQHRRDHLESSRLSRQVRQRRHSDEHQLTDEGPAPHRGAGPSTCRSSAT